MPSYNKQTLSKQAGELGFIRDTFEKMVRLTEMLSFISKDPLLSNALAQKSVTEYLTNLLTVSSKEQEYLDSFRNGKYKPELLFDDEDILGRIHNHPMALWKMQNRK